MKVIELDHDFGDTFCGVLTDAQGQLKALWANYNEQAGNDDMEEYCRGIPVSAIKPWLHQVCMYPFALDLPDDKSLFWFASFAPVLQQPPTV